MTTSTVLAHPPTATTDTTTEQALCDPAPGHTTKTRGADRRSRTSHRLSMLLTTRADLAGVSPVADILAEDLFWSA